MRMTNLLTQHLGMSPALPRVDATGAITRVYENDDLPLPMDVTGAVEGQRVCRKFQARAAFTQQNRTTEHHQYTDTPSGTFWCSTQTGASTDGEFSITVGVPFDDARWWRGRETSDRAVSTCPDESCCRRPSAELTERWNGRAWRAPACTRTCSPLSPAARSPAWTTNEVYNFLGRHASE